MALTPKQQRFVEEYLIDLNATAAYKRAGYTATGNAAETNAARLLRNAQVQAAIATAQGARSKRTRVTSDRILRELALLAFSDIGDILNFTGTDPALRPACEIPRRARRAISGIKTRRYTEGHGDAAREVEVTEFKLWCKLAALEKAGKHIGMFKEQHEHTGAGGGAIQVKNTHEHTTPADRLAPYTAALADLLTGKLGGGGAVRPDGAAEPVAAPKSDRTAGPLPPDAGG